MDIETKVCLTCGEEKKKYYFRKGKNTCNKCKREKIRRKTEKFLNSSLSINDLNTNSDGIQVLDKFLKSNEKVPVEKAKELVLNGKAVVYSEDTIYMTVAYKDDFVTEEVRERDDYTCHYCGNFGDTVDHIVPQSKGGKWTHENLVCCCKRCNDLKKDMSYKEFKKSKLWLKSDRDIKRIKNLKKEKEMKTIVVGYNKHGIPITKKIPR